MVSSPVWEDDRGSFREWFKRSEIFEKTGVDFNVEQSNVSLSKQGVIRGIHYSLASVGQAKWVTCLTGRIVDVVVDIRPASTTYKKFVTVDLVAGSGTSVFVGKGLGHGFIATENDSIVSYLLSSPYSPSDEFEINPLDQELGINWQTDLIGETNVVLSPKDANAPSLGFRLKQNQLPK